MYILRSRADARAKSDLAYDAPDERSCVEEDLIRGLTQVKTKVVSSTINPNWSEEFEVGSNYDLSHSDHLPYMKLRVYDSNRFLSRATPSSCRLSRA